LLVGGPFSVVALVSFLDATCTTDGAGVLYYVTSLPALFGVLFLALAARKNP
jgi:hypothetical protein